MSGGDKALTNSEHFKAIVGTTLTVKGFKRVTNIEMNALLNWDVSRDGPRPSDKVFAREVKHGNTIFGGGRNCPFLYFNGNKFRVIDARWQGGPGTTYEKFPYFVANASSNKLETIFVLGGSGFQDFPAVKAGATWLESRAKKAKNVIEVFFEEEFMEWANDENL